MMVDLDAAVKNWWSSDPFWAWLDEQFKPALGVQCREDFPVLGGRPCCRLKGHAGPHVFRHESANRFYVWNVWGEEDVMASIIVMARLLR